MAALNFPSSPSVDQIYTANNKSWIWDGVSWSFTIIDVSDHISITKAITLTTDWQDTGIQSTDLETGTYTVQLYANDISAGGTNNNEYYSGIISWYSGNTDSSVELPTDEVVLHRAGGSSDAGLYLRTFRSSSADLTDLQLQIYSNQANASSANYVFKFKKII